jgi:hypothetical protein
VTGQSKLTATPQGGPSMEFSSSTRGRFDGVKLWIQNRRLVDGGSFIETNEDEGFAD